MKCNSNSKLQCFQVIKDCVNCNYNKNTTLFMPIKSIQHYSYLCPFCFYVGDLDRFFIYGKNEKILKTRQCPNCHNKMLQSTLDYVVTLNLEGLINWIFDYPFWEYWKRIDFDKLIINLNSRNITNKFFEYYHIKKDLRQKEIDSKQES